MPIYQTSSYVFGDTDEATTLFALQTFGHMATRSNSGVRLSTMGRDIKRVQPDESADERETLTQRLDFLRATAMIKASGLTDEQAFARPVPASDLTIGGLLKHLSGVERWWFSLDFARLDIEPPWAEDDPAGGLPIEPGDTIAAIIDEYVAECERSRFAIDGHPLDAMAAGDDMHFNLRYALTHMIEETARHCGHLDLLRESIDGARGQ